MDFDLSLRHSVMNNIKKKYFNKIKKLARDNAKFGEVEKVLENCDGKIFKIMSRSTKRQLTRGDLSEKFNNTVCSKLGKKPSVGINLNQYNDLFYEKDRKHIILKFIKENE